MGIETAYNLIQNAFVDITIFNIGWILSIPMVLGTAWIITRDKDAQGFLWLPLTILYHIIGIKPSFIWYIIVTIVFTVKILSADRIGNIITTQIREQKKESGILYRNETRNKMKTKRLENLQNMFNKSQGFYNKKETDTLEELYNAILKGKGK